MKLLNVEYSKSEANKTFSIYVYAGSRTILFNEMTSWHPEKRIEFQDLIQRELKAKGKRRVYEQVNFLGLNKNCLTKENYFDFTLLSKKIIVCQSESLIKTIRMEKKLSRKALSKLLSVSYETIATYEHGRSSPTLQVISKLAQIVDNNGLMPFLEKHSLYYYKTNNHIVKLPLKPSVMVLALVSHLQPISGNYVSLTKDNSNTTEKINNFFCLKNNWSNSNRISNYILHNFLEVFYKYSK
ncbi:MAG: helix-turn-helix domain-containing protein [Candidatus Heimdallarchaeota archaeon]